MTSGTRALRRSTRRGFYPLMVTSVRLDGVVVLR